MNIFVFAFVFAGIFFSNTTDQIRPVIKIEGSVWISIKEGVYTKEMMVYFHNDYTYVDIFQTSDGLFYQPKQKVKYSIEETDQKILIISHTSPKQPPFYINRNQSDLLIYEWPLNQGTVRYRPITIEEADQKLKTWTLNDIDFDRLPTAPTERPKPQESDKQTDNKQQ